jgi:thymidine kinase
MSLETCPSINLIIGPMYSAKTTELLRRLSIYNDIGKRVIYVNTCIDDRTDTAFSTHNKTIGKLPFDSVKVEDLRSIDVSYYDVVGIDEAQFFPNLKDIVLDWVEKRGKILVVAGLNGDFVRSPFGGILDLLPYCDGVVMLSPFCTSCISKGQMRSAHFTKRKRGVSGGVVLVGGKASYDPVCRDCYLDS